VSNPTLQNYCYIPTCILGDSIVPFYEIACALTPIIVLLRDD
jgi:hypothetical protein